MTKTKEPMSLEEIRKAHLEFNRRWKASGKKLTRYACQRCKKKVSIRRPEESDVGERLCWDSLMMCIYCGGLSFVTVYPNGSSVAKIPTV